MTLTGKQVLEMISGTKGRWFSVKFIKRTDGSTRTMLCRVGVKSYLKGGDRAYNPTQFNLICVWDRHKKDYRSINLDGLISITINGVKYDCIRD